MIEVNYMDDKELNYINAIPGSGRGKSKPT